MRELLFLFTVLIVSNCGPTKKAKLKKTPQAVKKQDSGDLTKNKKFVQQQPVVQQPEQLPLPQQASAGINFPAIPKQANAGNSNQLIGNIISAVQGVAGLNVLPKELTSMLTALPIGQVANIASQIKDGNPVKAIPSLLRILSGLGGAASGANAIAGAVGGSKAGGLGKIVSGFGGLFLTGAPQQQKQLSKEAQAEVQILIDYYNKNK